MAAPIRTATDTLIALACGLLWSLAASGNPERVADQRAESTSPVVLLHGLARSARSMRRMEAALIDAGYATCNIDYPSTDFAIETLTTAHVLPAIRRCVGDAGSVHFVTHSMGGIIVRYLATLDDAPPIGRVVMLGPPNGGSEVVDRIGDWAAFDWVNGPAGAQLGTGADSLPRRLGEARFDVGIIAGRHSINWINSTMIPGSDDGKVAVSAARLAGMRDFLVLPVTHPMMMRDRTVIRETLHFLAYGAFGADDE